MLMCNTTINGKSPHNQRKILNFPIKCFNKYIKIQIISNTRVFGLLVNEYYQITWHCRRNIAMCRCTLFHI